MPEPVNLLGGKLLNILHMILTKQKSGLQHPPFCKRPPPATLTYLKGPWLEAQLVQDHLVPGTFHSLLL